MWPFRQQKPSHELGSDVSNVISEWKTRKYWRSLPPGVFQRFTDNAKYIFDDPRDLSVRHDDGLLAWLSARSFQRSNSDASFGNDGDDFLTDDTDRDHDAADSALEWLEPLARSTTESLITVG